MPSRKLKVVGDGCHCNPLAPLPEVLDTIVIHAERFMGQVEIMLSILEERHRFPAGVIVEHDLGDGRTLVAHTDPELLGHAMPVAPRIAFGGDS